MACQVSVTVQDVLRSITHDTTEKDRGAFGFLAVDELGLLVVEELQGC